MYEGKESEYDDTALAVISVGSNVFIIIACIIIFIILSIIRIRINIEQVSFILAVFCLLASRFSRIFLDLCESGSDYT